MVSRCRPVPRGVENFFVETRESCVTFNDRTRRETAKPGSSPLQTPLKFAGAHGCGCRCGYGYASPLCGAEVRGGKKRSKKSRQPEPGFLYFRGERDTRRGMNEWRDRTRGGCEKSCTREIIPVAIGWPAGARVFPRHATLVPDGVRMVVSSRSRGRTALDDVTRRAATSRVNYFFRRFVYGRAGR